MNYYIKQIRNIGTKKIRNTGIVIVAIIIPIFLASVFISGESGKNNNIQLQAELNAMLGGRQPLDCTKCHTAGQSPVNANDTINISSSCYKCHREDIKFLVNISKEIHIYHEGNIKALPSIGMSEYTARHKETYDNNCNSCHAWRSDRTPECTRCHEGGHIESKKGTDCGLCHGSLDNLFRHETIRLEIHNIFENKSCRMCHSQDKISLELANGQKVPITQASNLCKQCHSGTYKDWLNGNHISGVECVICHDPHSPRNINQTILGIAGKITAEKKVGPTPTPDSNNDEKAAALIKNYRNDYENVQQ
ncbi:Cytochrome c3 [uncultured archaeon]|nr:Cytochrome c3 [uncultured archaeon]